MPRILRETGAFPDWCQLSAFEILHPDSAGTRLQPKAARERIVAVTGGINVRFGTEGTVLSPGQFLDLPPDLDDIEIAALTDGACAVRLSGTWSGPLGGCGVFRAADTDSPSDKGDPVDYEKTTNIDSHYHDCDEYWIVVEGRGTVVVDGEAAEMGPGDCLCIGMGHHHDMSRAPEPVTAVYFETSLERQQRIGHLWEHTHGAAEPAEGRD
ncbi:cupin domain-containing protein [Pelagovum pacificum]|uniref:Cupin domain-containing protein n=1 Tax=Pelagovum pacificum TaxID=2588711 RepID=A0A5C5GHB0_9RHOB|nr:cupin domain-containing protein [Pelagovum pacificum]QQA42694.1 cupin domain-containing protein [Pelagovum pacificum]TNY34155.1 cupin domain-containing protein [Pelagovum pacificum]